MLQRIYSRKVAVAKQYNWFFRYTGKCANKKTYIC